MTLINQDVFNYTNEIRKDQYYSQENRFNSKGFSQDLNYQCFNSSNYKEKGSINSRNNSNISSKKIQQKQAKKCRKLILNSNVEEADLIVE